MYRFLVDRGVCAGVYVSGGGGPGCVCLGGVQGCVCLGVCPEEGESRGCVSKGVCPGDVKGAGYVKVGSVCLGRLFVGGVFSYVCVRGVSPVNRITDKQV